MPEQIMQTTAPDAINSERSFGIVMSAAFGLGAIWCAYVGHNDWIFPLGGIAAGFLTLGFIAPRVLRPLNWLWFKFGLLLHHIISPIVMGGLFFLAVTPIGLWMRLSNKDVLRLKRKPVEEESYWIERDPPGPAPESFRQQF